MLTYFSIYLCSMFFQYWIFFSKSFFPNLKHLGLRNFEGGPIKISINIDRLTRSLNDLLHFSQFLDDIVPSCKLWLSFKPRKKKSERREVSRVCKLKKFLFVFCKIWTFTEARQKQCRSTQNLPLVVPSLLD